MNRLYVFEPLHTITGACADHRCAVRASAITTVAAEIAAAMGVEDQHAAASTVPKPLLERIVTDLKENRGGSLLVAGPRQPPEVHALVAAINRKLGNVGKTVVYYEDSRPQPENGDPEPQFEMHTVALDRLVEKMQAGEVKNSSFSAGTRSTMRRLTCPSPRH